MERTVKKGNQWLIKAVLLILCFALVLTGVALLTRGNAAADDAVSQYITAEVSGTPHRGEDFTLRIGINGNDSGIYALRLAVTYDRSVMTLTNCTCDADDEGSDELLQGFVGSATAANTDEGGGYASYGTKPFILLWASTAKIAGNGDIAVLTFATNEAVTPGEYAVTVTVDTDNTMVKYNTPCSLVVNDNEQPGSDDVPVTILDYLNKVTLLDANGDLYATDGDNEVQTQVSIASALAKVSNVKPQKAATKQYTYEFSSWHLKAYEGNYRTYEPVFRATPVSYAATLHVGYKAEESIKWENFTQDEIDAMPGLQASFEDEKIVPYGTGIDYQGFKPADGAEYHFVGWYTDAACTVAATYAVMPSQNLDLYGYYALNADDSELTTVSFALSPVFDRENKYVIATLSIPENTNLGFNTVRFAPTCTAGLTFAGFEVLTTDLANSFSATYPVINAATEAGSIDSAVQLLDTANYTMEGQSFFYSVASGNSVTATGDLIKLIFKVSDDFTGAANVGISIGGKDLTRFVGENVTWYANATVTPAAFNVARVEKPTVSGTYTYSGAEQNFTVPTSAYYTNSDTAFTHAGEYTVTFTLTPEAGTYLTWSDQSIAPVECNVTVDPLSVTKPTAANGGNYVYTGESQTFGYENTSDWYELSGQTTGTTVADYTVTATLKNPQGKTDLVWAGGGTDPHNITFHITKKPIEKPAIGTNEFTYNGEEQTYELAASEGGWYTFDAAQTKKTNAGVYHVTISLAAAHAGNVKWADESETPLDYTFTINALEVDVPSAPQPNVFVFSDKANPAENVHTYDIATSPWYTIAGNSETAVGNYNATVTLNNPAEFGEYPNLVWKNAEAGKETEVLSYPFEITKKAIPVPVIEGKIFNGETQYGDVPAATEKYEVAPEGNPGGISVGTYYVTYKIKDTYFASYKWSTTAEQTVVVSYTIANDSNSWIVQPSVEEDKSYDGKKAQVIAVPKYGKDDLVIKYYSDDTGEELSDAPVTAGSYTVRFIVPAHGEDYGEMTKDLSLVIAKATVAQPVPNAQATYVYDGTEKTFDFTIFNSALYYVKEGSNKATHVDNYSVIVSLNDKANYAWEGVSADKESDDLSFPFVVSVRTVAKPAAPANSFVYTGSEQSYALATSAWYTVTDNAATVVGNYTATVTLNNPAGKIDLVWQDAEAGKETEVLSYPFSVTAKLVAKPAVDTSVFVYNGVEQTYGIAETEYYRVSGNKQTAVGSYVVKVSLKDKDNYQWDNAEVGKETEDLENYIFTINYSSLTASTPGESDVFTVTVYNNGGFVYPSDLTFEKNEITAALRAEIEAAAKTGALGQLTNERAAELTANKCVIARLGLAVVPAVEEGSYRHELTLPVARTGLVVVRIVNDEVQVFSTVAIGDKGLSFTSDGIGDFLILADHKFDQEVAEGAYLKSQATCADAAVYYKSCSCGVSSAAFTGETFVYGDPLGHDYDFDNIVWTWSSDHSSATARVVCKRDVTHVEVFNVKATVEEWIAPKVDEKGYAKFRASFTYEGQEYFIEYEEDVPSTGHVFTDPLPEWNWKTGVSTYVAEALFTCDCGEITVTQKADVTAEVDQENKKITYKARALFQGIFYEDSLTIDIPVVIFDYDTPGKAEDSTYMLPGDTITFEDAPAREGFTFVGWRSESGMLVVKYNNVYPTATVGFTNVTFTAIWNSFADVTVTVQDSDGNAIQNAVVKIKDGDVVIATETTPASGVVNYPKVPYGNYKLVVEYPYGENTTITRTDGLDVDEESVDITLKLPVTRFNTKVEGEGSSEGLEGAISDEEKKAIKEGAAAGTVNEIVITQKRDPNVDESLKNEIRDRMLREDPTGRSFLTDFYDVTIEKTTIVRNSEGAIDIKRENIKVSEKFQTNIFPVPAALRAELVAIGGNVDNVFVYKRHVDENGEVKIRNLQKVSEETGKNADYECFFIKRVAGEEYIAVRQKEYSVIAFGASLDPILLSNEIISLTLADRTYGDAAETPVVQARYGAGSVVFSYDTSAEGEFLSSVPPTAAGRYFVKAYIPATDTYSSAEKIQSFTIAKKVIAQPAEDNTEYTYNGLAQTYQIAASADYVVQGNTQTNAGTYTVVVTLADKDNTIWDTGRGDDLTYKFVIQKKKITEVEGIKFEGKKFWFNGKKHSIYISGELPEGITVEYKGNDEYELGKFTVTAVFKAENENYDVSEPMTARMHIRLNWVPILILIIVALAILIVVIVLVEKLMKKAKDEENNPPPADPQNPGDEPPTEGSEEAPAEEPSPEAPAEEVTQEASNEDAPQENAAEEGTNND